MSTTWSKDNDHEYYYQEKEENEHSITLVCAFALNILIFLLLYFWLYPIDEPPRNTIMHKLGTNPKHSRITGRPTHPTIRLTNRELRHLSCHETCLERQHHLSEDDQKTLTVVSDGELNYLRQASDLPTDATMNYGSLIVKRGGTVSTEVKKETKEQMENFDEGGLEDLYQLRRHKEPEKQQKNKKRKTKERQDNLDQLTRGVSAEPLMARIVDRHVQSRKVQKTVSAILRPERTQQTLDTTDDKTQERVLKKKPSSKPPTQKPSAHDINVKKKKSGTMKEKKQLTLREELSLARTIEETTRKQPSTISTMETPT